MPRRKLGALSRLRVLSLGAGVQSTCVYLMAMDGVIEPIDFAVFADTQEEPQHVYFHLWWLASLGGPPIIVASKGKLGHDLLQGTNSTSQRFASIPAFTSSVVGERGGMTRRQCSKEYKTQVIERAIRSKILRLGFRQRVPREVTLVQLFGISQDEARRSLKIRERVKHPEFPLLDLKMTRGDCKRYLASRVPHEVPKSACVFCPFHDQKQWRDLKSAGGPDWERAVEIDHALRLPHAKAGRHMNEKLYLHRSCVPLERADFNENQMELGFAVECEGMCGV